MIKALALAFALAVAAPQEGVPQDGVVVSPLWLQGQPPSRNVVVLFIGQRAEYEAEHIPGAVFAPGDTFTSSGALAVELPDPVEFERKLEALGVSDGSHVVLAYGRGALPSATRALFTLEAAGIKASLLDGGSAAWVEEGRPMIADVDAPKPGSLSPIRFNAPIVDAAYVQKAIGSAGQVIIDARDPQFYSGAQPGFGTQIRGHVQGAKSIPYTSLVNQEGQLKSPEEIREMFREAGVKEGDEVIAYCHVGQQASVIMLGARLAGVKATLYDGSFQEWSAKGLPVETTRSGE